MEFSAVLTVLPSDTWPSTVADFIFLGVPTFTVPDINVNLAWLANALSREMLAMMNRKTPRYIFFIK